MFFSCLVTQWLYIYLYFDLFLAAHYFLFCDFVALFLYSEPCWLSLLVLHSSSLGVALVIPLKGKIVTAEEVLAAGPQPRPRMETAIITLMHLAFHSEKIELEVLLLRTSNLSTGFDYLYSIFHIGIHTVSCTCANMQAVFMMCVISAIDPSTRYFFLD